MTALPQPDAGVTYAEKIDKAEARIDWTEPAESVDRKIRGLSPFPGAWTNFQGERIKLLGCRVTDGKGPAGTTREGLTIFCSAGAVEITRAQRAGKAAQDVETMLRGLDVPPGSRFGED